jgi:hypothetical protein
MILPDDIKQDTNLTATLPCIVTADDYHEFDFINDAYSAIGVKVSVEEVGFDISTRQYVALVHTNKPEHKKVVEGLCEYYESLEYDEPYGM